MSPLRFFGQKSCLAPPGKQQTIACPPIAQSDIQAILPAVARSLCMGSTSLTHLHGIPTRTFFSAGKIQGHVFKDMNNMG